MRGMEAPAERFVGVFTRPREMQPRQDALGKAFVYTPDAIGPMRRHLDEIGHVVYGAFDTESQVFRDQVGRLLGSTVTGRIVEVGHGSGYDLDEPLDIYNAHGDVELLEAA